MISVVSFYQNILIWKWGAEQTFYTQIKTAGKKQFDENSHYDPFNLHFLDTLSGSQMDLLNFRICLVRI